jgi:ribonuclease R
VEEILQKRKISPDQLDKYGIGKKELNNLAKFLPMLEKHTLELKKQRDAHGRLSLYIPELKIKESAKEGKSSLERFSFELEKRSNSMVEESMLSANQAACQFIKKKGEITLFRVHEKPDAENIYKLMTSLHFFGIEADISLERPELEIGNIIRKIKGHPLEGYFNIMILRSLKQAKYFHDPDIGHFGLGFRDYLHFTSPIRRYPDLVVHRQLKNFLAGGQPPYGREQIEQMAMQTSATERKSTDAERDIRQLFLCRLFREYEGREFAAYLSGAGRNAFYLTLREFPIEGRLLFQNIYGDYFDYFENEHTAIGRDTHRRFTLGDEIKVVLRKADWEERVLEFELDLV